MSCCRLIRSESDASSQSTVSLSTTLEGLSQRSLSSASSLIAGTRLTLKLSVEDSTQVRSSSQAISALQGRLVDLCSRQQLRLRMKFVSLLISSGDRP